jgi:hypothetical protein
VIAISRGHKPPAALALQVVLAHQAPYFFRVHDHPAMAKLGGNAAIAIGLKLIADRSHSRHDLPVIGFHRRRVVIG